jgi:hypothetical protein
MAQNKSGPASPEVKWASALELFVVVTKPGIRHTFNWQHGYHHNVIVAPICTGRERKDVSDAETLAVVLPSESVATLKRFRLRSFSLGVH